MKTHLVSQLYDKAGKQVQDIALANKAEVYYYAPKEIDPYRVDFFEKIELRDRIKLRNTYTVPAGQQVVVQTPEGEKKYTGGQFVPPEQMGKAQILENGPSGRSQGGEEGNSGDSSQNAQSSGSEGTATTDQWKNVFNSLKNVSSDSPEDLNKASYVLRQFIPEMPLQYDRSVSPAFKFACELSIANVLNSFPGIAKELLSNNLSISLKSTSPKEKSILEGFNIVAEVDLQKNQVTLYDIKKRNDDPITRAASNVSYIFGLLFAETIHTLLSTYDEEKVNEELANLQKALDRISNEYSSKNKGKTPVPGVNDDIDKFTEAIQSLTSSQELIGKVKNTLTSLKDAIDKENPFNAQTSTKVIGKVLQYVGVNSFAPNMGMEDSFETVASKYPETTYNIKKLIDNVSNT